MSRSSPGRRAPMSSGMVERRCSPRFRTAGTAIVLVGGRYVGAYLLRNLSAGGAYLVGDNNLAVGQVVQLLLQVGDELQSLEAEVVRQDRLPSEEHSLAVAFRHLSPDVEDSVRSLASDAGKDAQGTKTSAVLLLGGPSPVFASLDRDVRSLGFEVALAATPLDAIAFLSMDPRHITAVVAVCSHAGADPLGFLRFLKETYPQIRRIALSCAVRSLPGAPANPSGVIEAVLSEPWTSTSLAEALRPAGER
jgi:hypothetical protein